MQPFRRNQIHWHSAGQVTKNTQNNKSENRYKNVKKNINKITKILLKVTAPLNNTL